MSTAITKQSRYLYEFGPFRIDPDDRLLMRGDELVSLTPKAFDTLLLLVQKRGHLVEKTELMNIVWADCFVEEGNLTNAIWTLRKVLGDTGRVHKYVQTVAKHGYRFVGEVREVPCTEAERKAPSSRDGPQPRARWRTRLLFIAALAILSMAAGAGVLRLHKASGAAPSAPSAPVHSLAVLPFRTLGSDDAHAYLSVGLADLIITKLAGTGEIVVRPTTAVLHYAGKPIDLAAVGQQQKVEAILTGDIETLPDRVRVNVQLIRVSDESLLWASSYEEPPQQMSVLEDEVAEAVGNSMAIRLSPQAKMSLAHQDTGNAKAFQLYMEGRYFLNERSPEGLRRGAEYFQQAIDEDPQYALAYAGLADTYVFLGAYGEPPGHGHLTAKAAALKSLELDDSLADAYAALGQVSFRGEWNWSEAERNFQRAINLNPNDPITRSWYAMYSAAVGRSDEAVEQMRHATDLDPASPIIETALGRVLYFNRQYDSALEDFRSVIDMDPQFGRAHAHLGMVYIAKGEYNDAITEFQKDPQQDTYLKGLLGYTEAISGDAAAARKLLDELARASEKSPDQAFSTALIYVGLNDRDQALQWLEKAYQQRSSMYMPFAKTDPLLDPIRSDPRFAALLKQMGLS